MAANAPVAGEGKLHPLGVGLGLLGGVISSVTYGEVSPVDGARLEHARRQAEWSQEARGHGCPVVAAGRGRDGTSQNRVAEVGVLEGGPGGVGEAEASRQDSVELGG